MNDLSKVYKAAFQLIDAMLELCENSNDYPDKVKEDLLVLKAGVTKDIEGYPKIVNGAAEALKTILEG